MTDIDTTAAEMLADLDLELNAAGLHLVSNLDVVPGRLQVPEPMLEMDRTENPLRDLLTQPRFQAIEGMVAVPNEPGLGIDIDLDLLKAFRRKME